MNFKKLVAIITCACFIFSFVISQPLSAVIKSRRETGKFKEIFEQFTIPHTIGRVTKARYFGSSKVLINVQDLHCHAEVQRNIAKVLSLIDRKFRLKNVYQEGAIGQVDTSWLTSIRNKELKQSILESLIDEGKLSGAEYYSVTSRQPNLIMGVEDRQIYTNNLIRLAEILKQRKAIDARLVGFRSHIEDLKDIYYSSKNRKLEKLIKKHKNAGINSQKYYLKLKKYARKLDIDIYSYRNIIGFLELIEAEKKIKYKRVANQLKGFVSVLKTKLPYQAYKYLVRQTDNFSRTGELYVYLMKLSKEYKLNLASNFPDLNRFFEYIQASQKINPLDLITEEKMLLGELRARLSKSASEREVSFLVGFFSYLEDYLANKISAEDYDYFKKSLGEFKLLWAKYSEESGIDGLSRYFDLFGKYYKDNIKRNGCFINNILGDICGQRPMPVSPYCDHEQRILASLKDATDVYVVVTGGFHTPGLARLLEQREISYLVVTPNVTQDTKIADQVYKKLIRQQGRMFAKTEKIGTVPNFSTEKIGTVPIFSNSLGVYLISQGDLWGFELIRQAFKHYRARNKETPWEAVESQVRKEIHELLELDLPVINREVLANLDIVMERPTPEKLSDDEREFHIVNTQADKDEDKVLFRFISDKAGNIRVKEPAEQEAAAEKETEPSQPGSGSDTEAAFQKESNKQPASFIDKLQARLNAAHKKLKDKRYHGLSTFEQVQYNTLSILIEGIRFAIRTLGRAKGSTNMLTPSAPEDAKRMGEEAAADPDGKCLTPDSIIQLEGGRTKQLIELVPGDMVMSLNESTGRLEPRRVNALMYMGNKPVYRLTTASGRSVKTTANHPYLTKDGWVKASKLEVGDNIAVPKGVNEHVFYDCGFQYKEKQAKILVEKVFPLWQSFLFSLPRIDKYSANNAKYSQYYKSNPDISRHPLKKVRGKSYRQYSLADISNILCNEFSGRFTYINHILLLVYPIFSFMSSFSNGFVSNVFASEKPLNNLILSGNDIKWDKITSIEHIGSRDVYDIEVEGTHNFIANGILAHNTAFSDYESIFEAIYSKYRNVNMQREQIQAMSDDILSILQRNPKITPYQFAARLGKKTDSESRRLEKAYRAVIKNIAAKYPELRCVKVFNAVSDASKKNIVERWIKLFDFIPKFTIRENRKPNISDVARGLKISHRWLRTNIAKAGIDYRDIGIEKYYTGIEGQFAQKLSDIKQQLIHVFKDTVMSIHGDLTGKIKVKYMAGRRDPGRTTLYAREMPEVELELVDIGRMINIIFRHGDKIVESSIEKDYALKDSCFAIKISPAFIAFRDTILGIPLDFGHKRKNALLANIKRWTSAHPLGNNSIEMKENLIAYMPRFFKGSNKTSDLVTYYRFPGSFSTIIALEENKEGKDNSIVLELRDDGGLYSSETGNSIKADSNFDSPGLFTLNDLSDFKKFNRSIDKLKVKTVADGSEFISGGRSLGVKIGRINIKYIPNPNVKLKVKTHRTRRAIDTADDFTLNPLVFERIDSAKKGKAVIIESYQGTRSFIIKTTDKWQGESTEKQDAFRINGLPVVLADRYLNLNEVLRLVKFIKEGKIHDRMISSEDVEINPLFADTFYGDIKTGADGVVRNKVYTYKLNLKNNVWILERGEKINPRDLAKVDTRTGRLYAEPIGEEKDTHTPEEMKKSWQNQAGAGQDSDIDSDKPPVASIFKPFWQMRQRWERQGKTAKNLGISDRIIYHLGWFGHPGRAAVWEGLVWIIPVTLGLSPLSVWFLAGIPAIFSASHIIMRWVARALYPELRSENGRIVEYGDFAALIGYFALGIAFSGIFASVSVSLFNILPSISYSIQNIPAANFILSFLSMTAVHGLVNLYFEGRDSAKFGKCLTPDSIIQLEGGRTKQLIELVPGDMVMSLNESTGRLEPHRVNALMYMGNKPVYRLTTASGRSVKTTANHPYLTKDGWVKVSKLEVGDNIAVPDCNILAPIGMSADFNTLDKDSPICNIERRSVNTYAKAMVDWRKIYQGFGPCKRIVETGIIHQFFNYTFLNIFWKGFKVAFSTWGKFYIKHTGIYAKPSSCWTFLNGIKPFFWASAIDFLSEIIKSGLRGSFDSILSISHPAGFTDLSWYSSVERRSTSDSSIAESISRKANVSKRKTCGVPLLSVTIAALDPLLNLIPDFLIAFVKAISFACFSFDGISFIVLSPLSTNVYEYDVSGGNYRTIEVIKEWFLLLLRKLTFQISLFTSLSLLGQNERPIIKHNKATPKIISLIGNVKSAKKPLIQAPIITYLNISKNVCDMSFLCVLWNIATKYPSWIKYNTLLDGLSRMLSIPEAYAAVIQTKDPDASVGMTYDILHTTYDSSDIFFDQITSIEHIGRHGNKPVFRLTTASGRSVKTTANHPYLTRNGWKKLMDIQEWEEIAVPKGQDHFNSFKQSEALRILNGKPDLSDKKCLLSETSKSACAHSEYAAIKASAGLSPKDSYLAPIAKGTRSSSSIEDMACIILINWLNNIGGRLRLVSLTIVRGISSVCFGKDSIISLSNVSEGGFLAAPSAATNSFVSRTNRKFFLPEGFSDFPHLINSFIQAQTFKWRFYCIRYFFGAVQTFYCFNDVFLHCLLPLNIKYNTLLNGLSRMLSIPEAYAAVIQIPTLQSGSRFNNVGTKDPDASVGTTYNILHTTYGSSDIFFDQITSIEHIGSRDVYDIEVEGTHNFIANGILAHNTAFGGTEEASKSGIPRKAQGEDQDAISSQEGSQDNTRLKSLIGAVGMFAVGLTVLLIAIGITLNITHTASGGITGTVLGGILSSPYWRFGVQSWGINRMMLSLSDLPEKGEESWLKEFVSGIHEIDIEGKKVSFTVAEMVGLKSPRDKLNELNGAKKWHQKISYYLFLLKHHRSPFRTVINEDGTYTILINPYYYRVSRRSEYRLKEYLNHELWHIRFNELSKKHWYEKFLSKLKIGKVHFGEEFYVNARETRRLVFETVVKPAAEHSWADRIRAPPNELLSECDKTQFGPLRNRQRFIEDTVEAVAEALNKDGTVKDGKNIVEAFWSIQNFKDQFNERGKNLGIDYGLGNVAIEVISKMLLAASIELLRKDRDTRNIKVDFANDKKTFFCRFTNVPDNFSVYERIYKPLFEDPNHKFQSDVINKIKHEIEKNPKRGHVGTIENIKSNKPEEYKELFRKFGWNNFHIYGGESNLKHLERSGTTVKLNKAVDIADILDLNAFYASKMAQTNFDERLYGDYIELEKMDNELKKIRESSPKASKKKPYRSKYQAYLDASDAFIIKLDKKRKEQRSSWCGYTYDVEKVRDIVESYEHKGDWYPPDRIKLVYNPDNTYKKLKYEYKKALKHGVQDAIWRTELKLIRKIAEYERLWNLRQKAGDKLQIFCSNEEYKDTINYILSIQPKKGWFGTFVVGGDEFGKFIWSGRGDGEFRKRFGMNKDNTGYIFRLDVNYLGTLSRQLGGEIGDRVKDDMLRLTDKISDPHQYLIDIYDYFSNKSNKENFKDNPFELSDRDLGHITKHLFRAGLSNKINEYIKIKGDKTLLVKVPPVIITENGFKYLFNPAISVGVVEVDASLIPEEEKMNLNEERRSSKDFSFIQRDANTKANDVKDSIKDHIKAAQREYYQKNPKHKGPVPSGITYKAYRQAVKDASTMMYAVPYNKEIAKGFRSRELTGLRIALASYIYNANNPEYKEIEQGEDFDEEIYTPTNCLRDIKFEAVHAENVRDVDLISQRIFQKIKRSFTRLKSKYNPEHFEKIIQEFVKRAKDENTNKVALLGVSGRNNYAVGISNEIINKLQSLKSKTIPSEIQDTQAHVKSVLSTLLVAASAIARAWRSGWLGSIFMITFAVGFAALKLSGAEVPYTNQIASAASAFAAFALAIPITLVHEPDNSGMFRTKGDASRDNMIIIGTIAKLEDSTGRIPVCSYHIEEEEVPQEIRIFNTIMDAAELELEDAKYDPDVKTRLKDYLGKIRENVEKQISKRRINAQPIVVEVMDYIIEKLKQEATLFSLADKFIKLKLINNIAHKKAVRCRDISKQLSKIQRAISGRLFDGSSLAYEGKRGTASTVVSNRKKRQISIFEHAAGIVEEGINKLLQDERDREKQLEKDGKEIDPLLERSIGIFENEIALLNDEKYGIKVSIINKINKEAIPAAKAVRYYMESEPEKLRKAAQTMPPESKSAFLAKADELEMLCYSIRAKIEESSNVHGKNKRLQRNIFMKAMEDSLSDTEKVVTVQNIIFKYQKYLEERVPIMINRGIGAVSAVSAVMIEYLHEHEKVKRRFRGKDGKLSDDDIHLVINYTKKVMQNIDKAKKKETHEGVGEILFINRTYSPNLLWPKIKNRLAVVNEKGSFVAHDTIITKNRGIPSVCEAKGSFSNAKTGEVAIIDYRDGTVIIRPTQEVFDRYLIEKERLEVYNKVCMDNANKSIDNYHGKVKANTEYLDDVEEAMKSGAEGIGLDRTEAEFNRRPLKAEDLKDGLVKRLKNNFIRKAKATKGTYRLRLLDRAGDKIKHMTSLPGSNLTSAQYLLKDDFGKLVSEAMIEAALLAYIESPNIELMFPMITQAIQARDARAMFERVRYRVMEELETLDIKTEAKTLKDVKLGYMVEHPDAFIRGNLVAILKYADFISFGSNDYIHYKYDEVDRYKGIGLEYYKELKKEVLLAIIKLVKETKKRGKNVCVCGDLAYLDVFLPFVMACDHAGLTFNISMPAGITLARAKHIMRNLDPEECYKVFEKLIRGARNIDMEEINKNAQERIYKAEETIRTSEDYIKAKDDAKNNPANRVLGDKLESLNSQSVKGNSQTPDPLRDGGAVIDMNIEELHAQIKLMLENIPEGLTIEEIKWQPENFSEMLKYLFEKKENTSLQFLETITKKQTREDMILKYLAIMEELLPIRKMLISSMGKEMVRTDIGLALGVTNMIIYAETDTLEQKIDELQDLAGQIVEYIEKNEGEMKLKGRQAGGEVWEDVNYIISSETREMLRKLAKNVEPLDAYPNLYEIVNSIWEFTNPIRKAVKEIGKAQSGKSEVSENLKDLNRSTFVDVRPQMDKNNINELIERAKVQNSIGMALLGDKIPVQYIDKNNKTRVDMLTLDEAEAMKDKITGGLDSFRVVIPGFDSPVRIWALKYRVDSARPESGSAVVFYFDQAMIASATSEDERADLSAKLNAQKAMLLRGALPLLADINGNQNLRQRLWLRGEIKPDFVRISSALVHPDAVNDEYRNHKLFTETVWEVPVDIASLELPEGICDELDVNEEYADDFKLANGNMDMRGLAFMLSDIVSAKDKRQERKVTDIDRYKWLREQVYHTRATSKHAKKLVKNTARKYHQARLSKEGDSVILPGAIMGEFVVASSLYGSTEEGTLQGLDYAEHHMKHLKKNKVNTIQLAINIPNKDEDKHTFDPLNTDNHYVADPNAIYQIEGKPEEFELQGTAKISFENYYESNEEWLDKEAAKAFAEQKGLDLVDVLGNIPDYKDRFPNEFKTFARRQWYISERTRQANEAIVKQGGVPIFPMKITRRNFYNDVDGAIKYWMSRGYKGVSIVIEDKTLIPKLDLIKLVETVRKANPRVADAPILIELPEDLKRGKAGDLHDKLSEFEVLHVLRSGQINKRDIKRGNISVKIDREFAKVCNPTTRKCSNEHAFFNLLRNARKKGAVHVSFVMGALYGCSPVNNSGEWYNDFKLPEVSDRSSGFRQASVKDKMTEMLSRFYLVNKQAAYKWAYKKGLGVILPEISRVALKKLVDIHMKKDISFDEVRTALDEIEDIEDIEDSKPALKDNDTWQAVRHQIADFEKKAKSTRSESKKGKLAASLRGYIRGVVENRIAETHGISLEGYKEYDEEIYRSLLFVGAWLEVDEVGKDALLIFDDILDYRRNPIKSIPQFNELMQGIIEIREMEKKDAPREAIRHRLEQLYPILHKIMKTGSLRDIAKGMADSIETAWVMAELLRIFDKHTERDLKAIVDNIINDAKDMATKDLEMIVEGTTGITISG